MVALFPLGQVVATPGALAALERAKQPATCFLARHAVGFPESVGKVGESEQHLTAKDTKRTQRLGVNPSAETILDWPSCHWFPSSEYADFRSVHLASSLPGSKQTQQTCENLQLPGILKSSKALHVNS